MLTGLLTKLPFWAQLLIQWTPKVIGFGAAIKHLHTNGVSWGSAALSAVYAIGGLVVKPVTDTGGTIATTQEAGARLDLTDHQISKLPGEVPEALTPGTKGAKGATSDPGQRGKTGRAG